MMKRPFPSAASSRRDEMRSQGRDGARVPGRWSAGRHIGSPPRRSRLGSTLLFGGLALAALAAITVGFLLGMVPATLVRDELVRDVKVQTGRDLVVAGQTSVSFFPSLAVTMSDVSLSPPPGMAGEPTVRIRRVDATVPLSALFTSRVNVTSLLLTDPVFDLRVDRQGRRSWEHTDQWGAPPSISGSSPPGHQRAPRSRSIEDTDIEEIRIVNGAVRYSDERTGMRHEATGLDLTISGGSKGNPIKAEGNLVWRAERLGFSARLGTSPSGQQNRPVDAAIAVRSPHLTVDYRGMAALGDSPHLDGTLTIGAPSLKGLADWLGAGPPARDFGAVAFKSRIRGSTASLALMGAELTLAGSSATGTINVDTSGTRPHVRADLKVSALDLDAYSQPAAAAPGSAGRPPTAAGAAPPSAQGWSEDTIDLGPFGIADIDAKLALGRLTYGGMHVGQTSATVTLKNRVLRVSLDDARLYEGRGRGVISIDGTGGEPAVSVDLVFDQVSMLPMLTDAAGFDWLAGSTNLQLRLAGRGASERAIVESLSGSAAVRVVDGAIVGINIPQVVRSLRQGRFSDFTQVGTEKTDFTEMTANFRIEGGVAETENLSMLSPLMRLTATGTVDLGRRQLDATLRPRLVGSLSGQGGAQDLAGLELPIRLSGPWSEPQLSADIDAVLKDPDKAVEAIKEIGKQLDGSGLGEVLRKLLGDDKGAGKSGKSGSFLDDLFK
ncbi:MAG TPA: AsmA family protein [Hyphomicrobiaceae bacterium]|nr:AsmA family protein [Hyphomicrobiaceae bacterium]